MLALSIRQPYAELILRGIKTVEYRTRATKIVGERFYIYASKQKAVGSRQKMAWSADLDVAQPPEWMVELAEQVGMIEADALLPTGVIVGSAVIESVSQIDSTYRWHLGGVERARTLRKPERHPQPAWFRPF
jgi:hypothetical protein